METHKLGYIREVWADLMVSPLFNDVDIPYDGQYILNTLIALYSDPRRKYHNLNHIWDCLRKVDERINKDRYTPKIEKADTN